LKVNYEEEITTNNTNRNTNKIKRKNQEFVVFVRFVVKFFLALPP